LLGLDNQIGGNAKRVGLVIGKGPRFQIDAPRAVVEQFEPFASRMVHLGWIVHDFGNDDIGRDGGKQ
jgi:hypothetical protein